MKNRTIPKLIIDKVWQIDGALLRALGVSALIVDVDNTLSPHGAPQPTAEVLPWLKRMNALGVPVIILSNNTKKRVEPFAKLLSLDFVHFAAKPLPNGFRLAAKRLLLPPERIAVVGDQIFTDILGGNLAGMKTILVRPMEEDTDGFVRFKRRFEQRFIDRYYRQKEGGGQ